jgi:hypothetical protein
LQEAEARTGYGDDGVAATREYIAVKEEMDSLVAEIDRIDKARKTSDAQVSDQLQLGQDIRQEALQRLSLDRRKRKQKTNNVDNEEGGDGDASTRPGEVPQFTPNKSTRLGPRCAGTPDSSTGSEENQSLGSVMSEFAAVKQAGIKVKEASAEAALLDAETRAAEAKSRSEMAAKEADSRAKGDEANRTMMLQMANVLSKIADKLQ